MIRVLLFLTIFTFSFGKEDEVQPDFRVINLKGLSNELTISQERLTNKLDSFFCSRSERGLFNGTVLFAKEGKVLYKNAFGYANFKTKDILDVSSSFQLASVSKPITALGILKLVEEGIIKLSDSIQVFIPELPYKGITIEHLLSHRSGLPEYMYFADKHWPDWSSPMSNEDVIKLMVKHKPAVYYSPNRRYNYCNTNYSLLATVIERATNSCYEEYMKNEIFVPLGMKHTFIYNRCLQDKIDKAYATQGHDRSNRKIEETYLNGVVGDKGIYSSVEDLFKLDQALCRGTLLCDSTLQKAYQPRHRDLWISDNYGLGWRINAKNKDQKLIYHAGWWKGYKSYFIRIPQSETTIIVLTNTVRNRFFSLKKLLKLTEQSV